MNLDQLKICEANKCTDCDKCVWIKEAGSAIINYGKETYEAHPLYNYIVDKFK